MDVLSKFVFLPGSHTLLIFFLYPSLYIYFQCFRPVRPQNILGQNLRLKTFFSIDTVAIHSAHNKSLASEHMTSLRHSFKLILEVTLFARLLHPPVYIRK